MKTIVKLPITHGDIIVANISKEFNLPDLDPSGIYVEFKLNDTLTVERALIVKSINLDTGLVTLVHLLGKGVGINDVDANDVLNYVESMKINGWDVELNHSGVDDLVTSQNKPYEKIGPAAPTKKRLLLEYCFAVFAAICLQLLTQAYLLDWTYSVQLFEHVTSSTLGSASMLVPIMFVRYKLKLKKSLSCAT
ncbi:hypothetical protein [Moritella sp. F3]|uniref:hypothetical protein n=1 Tax=Moritella sp. F3 TaxID=2718882 RepID=UPI0018E1BAD3|nr:hypothetical protein [Moritella sp. F3]GIC77632.1 hypothetical protein FMO001_23590 [Moritella sp. F1]GIC82045.1 hypothetical protein FMO003_23260 [Moritella sp. F3]